MPDRRIDSRRRKLNERRIEERRLNDRILAQAELRLLRKTHGPPAPIEGLLYDASERGIRVLLCDPLEPAEPLLIEIRETSGSCLNLSARCVWCEPYIDEWHQVGCELPRDLTPRQFQLLKSLAVGPRQP